MGTGLLSDAGAIVTGKAPTWEITRCAICDTPGGGVVLAVAHPDAPGGTTAIVQCGRCGLRRLDPRPGPEVIGRYYDSDSMAYGGRQRAPLKQAVWNWLRDASSGCRTRLTWLPGVPWLARLAARYVFDINVDLRGRGDAPLRVLDVGCGFGDLLIWLQSRGCVVQGVDLDERAAARARQYGVPVHVGRLEDMLLPEASFDVAVMCHSLEHVPDPAGILRGIRHVLRPEGRLHIAVPNGESAGFRLEAASWGHLSHPIHFWFFSSDDCRRLMTDVGFEVTEVRFRSTWADHVKLWRGSLGSAPIGVVMKDAVRFILEVAMQRRAGDIVSLVGRRGV